MAAQQSLNSPTSGRSIDSRGVDSQPLSPFSLAINKMSESTEDLRTKEPITPLGAGILGKDSFVGLAGLIATASS